MHEFTITQSILSIVLQKAEEVKALRVKNIDLLVGRLTGYVPECIQLQFNILSHNTIADGAILSVRQPPINLHCHKCNKDYTAESFDLKCQNCGTMEIDILSGSELFIESMDVE
jgi:hydrogenase nickel incorporation protein HypA/HybF